MCGQHLAPRGILLGRQYYSRYEISTKVAADTKTDDVWLLRSVPGPSCVLCLMHPLFLIASPTVIPSLVITSRSLQCGCHLPSISPSSTAGHYCSYWPWSIREYLPMCCPCVLIRYWRRSSGRRNNDSGYLATIAPQTW